MASGTRDRNDRQLERALEHPLRARMVEELKRESVDPPALAAALDRPLDLVAYHYRVLEAVGGLPPADQSAK